MNHRKVHAEYHPNTRQKPNCSFLVRVVLKAILLFLVLNFAVAFIPQVSSLGRVSLYNILFPGRVRLPFGENPDQAYNLSIYDLEAMFASHEITAGAKPGDEFRVILIGDSATWGILLEPEDTLSGLINLAGLSACDGRIVRTYNLAYPSMSLAKDLMILEIARQYQPDLVIWPITLESMPKKLQLATPLAANNPHRLVPLIKQFHLGLDPEDRKFNTPSFWGRTLVGRRRAVLDAVQLQLYGVLWAGTGVDQTYPDDIAAAQRDFQAGDTSFHGWEPGQLTANQLAFDILEAGSTMLGRVHLLVVNEPILISDGENSDLRYNFFYPRWAYDQYRQIMAGLSSAAPWAYTDLWDSVPASEFTNSAVHLTPRGSEIYFEALQPEIEALLCTEMVQ